MRASIIFSIGLLVGFGTAEAHAQNVKSGTRGGQKTQRRGAAKSTKRVSAPPRRQLNRVAKDKKLRRALERGKQKSIVLGAREGEYTTKYHITKPKTSFAQRHRTSGLLGLDHYTAIALVAPRKVKWRQELVLTTQGLAVRTYESSATPEEQILTRALQGAGARMDQGLPPLELLAQETKFGPFSKASSSTRLVRTSHLKLFDMRPKLEMRDWSHLTSTQIAARVDAWVASNE